MRRPSSWQSSWTPPRVSGGNAPALPRTGHSATSSKTVAADTRRGKQVLGVAVHEVTCRRKARDAACSAPSAPGSPRAPRSAHRAAERLYLAAHCRATSKRLNRAAALLAVLSWDLDRFKHVKRFTRTRGPATKLLKTSRSAFARPCAPGRRRAHGWDELVVILKGVAGPPGRSTKRPSASTRHSVRPWSWRPHAVTT